MKIGSIDIPSRLALAPMAGVTDLAFRQICSELGAGLTCTELVSSKALCYQDHKTRGLLKQFPGEHPAAAQIFGSDPECMARGAQLALEYSGADLIDINMGCPVGKVVSNGDGSALMKDIPKALQVAKAVVKSRSRAGHSQNAHRLGSGAFERCGTGPRPGRHGRSRHRCPRPHPRADVQRTGRLGRYR